MKAVMTIGKYLLIIIMSLWVGLFIWTHQPLGQIFTELWVTLWAILALSCLIGLICPHRLPKFFSAKLLPVTFITLFASALIAFFSLQPSNSREWQPEVSNLLDFVLAKDGHTITLVNVRNFDWQTDTAYQPRWETRQYDLDKLQSLDLIASYWMGDAIAHTLVSFTFSDAKRVAFSIEIRKEKTETFSALGGFFRNYEIIVIAADEKDIIYTRSNARHENVYIYPLTVPKADLKPLFLAYVNKARGVKNQPEWYNSLTNNCTTAMYPLFGTTMPAPVDYPWDYRWIVSGYFPNYLYDLNKIEHRYTFEEWHEKAHINPKSAPFSSQNPISSSDYSALIRQDFYK